MTEEPDSGSASPLPITRRQVALAVAIAIATLAFGAIRMAPGVVGAYHDDGVYVATGKALAEGRGYVQPFLPQALPETKYPPLLPAFFALIWMIAPGFPGNAILFQGSCLVALALSNALAYLFLIRYRYATPGAALVALGFVVTSPTVLYHSVQPLSEGPFALLMILAFWAFEETIAAERRAWEIAPLAGALVAIAGYCRTIGFVWVGVGAAILFLRRRPAAIPFLLFSVPPMAAWIAWAALSRPAHIPPIFYHYFDYGSWWRTSMGPGLFRVLGFNLLWTLHGIGDAIMPGLMILSVLLVRTAVWAWAIITIIVGLRVWPLMRAKRALPWMIAAYFVPVVLWPWPPGRFWIPMAPLAAGLFVSGAAAFVRRRWPNRMRLAVDAALLGMILNLFYLALLKDVTRKYHYPIALPGLVTPRWESLEEGYAWIRANTPPRAIVAAALDPMLWLYTGRRSFRFYNQQATALFYDDSQEKIEDPDGLLANLRTYGASYVLDAPVHNFAVGETLRGRIAKLALRYPPPIEEVFRSRDGEVRVYRVRPAGGD